MTNPPPESRANEVFGTGAKRDTHEGKGRYDLIAPEFEKAVADRLEMGAKLYGDRNWENGFPVSRCFDSAKRHLNEWMGGDRKEDHLAAAAVNIMFMIATISRCQQNRLPQELLNYPAGELDSNRGKP